MNDIIKLYLCTLVLIKSYNELKKTTSKVNSFFKARNSTEFKKTQCSFSSLKSKAPTIVSHKFNLHPCLWIGRNWNESESHKWLIRYVSIKNVYFPPAEFMKEAGNVFSQINWEKPPGSRGLGQVQISVYRPHEIHFFVLQFWRLNEPTPLPSWCK